MIVKRDPHTLYGLIILFYRKESGLVNKHKLGFIYTSPVHTSSKQNAQELNTQKRQTESNMCTVRAYEH